MSFYINVFCQEISNKKEYFTYHNAITEAEKSIFLDRDSIKGLKIFNDLFKAYDFVFVDDCIEAFQLALFFKQDSYALKFIEKAIKNGFQLKLLDILSTGSIKKDDTLIVYNVSIYNNFLKFHKKELDSLEIKYFPKFLKRIKKYKELIIFFQKRHILEQFYKQNEKKIVDFNNYPKTYKEISDQNLEFIISHFRAGKFLGERNLGIYTEQFAKSLGILSIDSLAYNLISSFKCNDNLNAIPYLRERDYFASIPLFIMLYHNPKSFDLLAPYSEKAIAEGFLHPREYAILLRNSKNTKVKYNKLYLENFQNLPEDTKEINKIREEMHLPPIEVDFYKLKFQKEKNVQLFFGFLSISK